MREIERRQDRAAQSGAGGARDPSRRSGRRACPRAALSHVRARSRRAARGARGGRRASGRSSPNRSTSTAAKTRTASEWPVFAAAGFTLERAGRGGRHRRSDTGGQGGRRHGSGSGFHPRRGRSGRSSPAGARRRARCRRRPTASWWVRRPAPPRSPRPSELGHPHGGCRGVRATLETERIARARTSRGAYSLLGFSRWRLRFLPITCSRVATALSICSASVKPPRSTKPTISHCSDRVVVKVLLADLAAARGHSSRLS